MSNTNWIQLSDIHIYDHTNWQIMQYAYQQLANILSPDFIVVTGDYRHLRDNKDYDNANIFLKKIAAEFRVPIQNVFMVPGNHDVNDFEFRHEIIKTILSEIDSNPDCYIRYTQDTDLLSSAFKDYSTFVKCFYGDTVIDDRVNNPSKINFYTWNNEFNIIMLNTALICDGDDHPQIIDINALSKLTIHNNLPSIILCHHPIEDLTKEQQDVLSILFEKLRVCAILCGDKHKLSINRIQTKSACYTIIPEIISGKSVIQPADNYSDLSVIHYEKRGDFVYVQGYEFDDRVFKTSNFLYHDVNQHYFFPMTCAVNNPLIASEKNPNGNLLDDIVFESNINNEESFIAYVQSKLSDVGFAPSFLKAGLSSDLNLDGRLTPEIFVKHFLVKDKQEKYACISSRIHELFRSDINNLLCIESNRGSGKSTFVNTVQLSTDKRYHYEYPYPYIDFTKKTDSNAYCEDDIFQLFLQQYYKMMNNRDWSQAFYNRLDRISFLKQDINGKYLKQFDNFIDALSSNKIMDYYSKHNDRISSCQDCDIKLYLLFYLMALATKPQIKNTKETRWIIIFDGLEAYATTDARKVILTISEIHEFLRAAFDLVGLRSSFFTKFTFIIPVRTATSLDMQDAVDGNGRNIWGGSKEYIVKLPQFDFSLEALLKKIKFLASLVNSIDEIKTCPLIRRCTDIVSTLIPQSLIYKYLRDELDINSVIEKVRYFAEQRFLPLLNHDHRCAIDKLYDLAKMDIDDPNVFALSTIEQSINSKRFFYSIDCALNGKNMILLRNIFNNYHHLNLLDTIGYTDFDDNHQPSIARTMLNFLYYKELKHILMCKNEIDAGAEYDGVPFASLLDQLKPFAERDITHLSNIIFNASALNSATQFAYSWTNLITIRGLENRLDTNRLIEIIRAYYNSNNERVHQLIKNWRVKLSDAGICFTCWASKQFEFILSRCNSGSSALFAYDADTNIDGFTHACELVYAIIYNQAINEFIDTCLSDCTHHKTKDVCDNKECDILKNNPIECSMFQRYQECLRLITDSIDYIDRYRVYTLQVGLSENKPESQLQTINQTILFEIKQFNSLYIKLEEKLKTEFNMHELLFENMKSIGASYKSLRRKLKNRDYNRVGAKYVKSFRLPRSSRYYFDSPNEMERIINIAIKSTSPIRLFDIRELEEE